jgi:hypothetical protein
METSQSKSEQMAARFPHMPRRSVALLAGLLALLLAVAGGPGRGGPAPAAAQTIDPDQVQCLLNLCINNLWIIPHGTYVEVVPTSNKPVSFYVEVSTGPALPNGTFASVTSSGTSFCCSTGWAGKVFNLQPNTKYYYILRATAQNGQQANRNGSFKTLKRHVSVTFQQLYMIDDSDSLPNSDCDCLFWFQSGNESPKHYGDMDVGVATGENVWPNATFTHWNVASLRLRAEVIDRDCPTFGCGTNAEIVGPFWDGAGHFQFPSEDASMWIYPTPLALGVESYTENFQMTSPFAYDFTPKFTVYGSFTVSYVP